MKDIELIHGDSLQALKGYGDNYFDVAIVDPPYGLGFDGEMASMTISPNMGSERKKRWNGKKINQYTKKDCLHNSQWLSSKTYYILVMCNLDLKRL